MAARVPRTVSMSIQGWDIGRKEATVRKLAFLVVLSGVFGSLLVLPATADDNKTVNAMVTPKVISITVSTNTLQYDTLSVGTLNNVPTPTKVTVTNTGTVDADFRVRGLASTPGNWTLTSGVPGANAYRHEYDVASSGDFFGALAIASEDVYNDVLPGVSKDIFFG